MLEVISALLIVIAGIALLRVALGGPGGAGRAARRRLRVVETCPLGGRQRLHLVEADGERLLIGASEASITLMRRLGRVPEEVAPAPETPARSRIGSAAARSLRLLRGAAPLAAVALLVARTASAAEGAEALLPDLAGVLSGATQPDGVSTTLQIVALVTLISVAPSILLMATCFTRVLIVLAFLRQAIGIQQLPPNQVLVGLALFVTLFVMAPVGERIHSEAFTPYVERQIDGPAAAERAIQPVREFLAEFTREKDLALFTSLAGEEPQANLEEVPLFTLLPAYMLSELRTAFEIGFMIYLPFLIIDLVVSSMLISMGMIVLPPIVISLPFKLMLFVLLDGWNLVVSSLVSALR